MPSRLGRPPPGQVCVAAAANKAEEPLLLLLLNTDVVVLSRNRPAVAESRDEAAKGSLMMNVFVVVYYPVSVKKYDKNETFVRINRSRSQYICMSIADLLASFSDRSSFFLPPPHTLCPWTISQQIGRHLPLILLVNDNIVPTPICILSNEAQIIISFL